MTILDLIDYQQWFSMISRLLIEWSTPATHCRTYFITQPTMDPNHEWSERNANHVTQHVILFENELLFITLATGLT